jgi:hypothetical protein
MFSVKTILALIGDNPQSLRYCSRLGSYLSQLYPDNRVRVVLAIWSLSYLIKPPPSLTVALSGGPYYLCELPKPHLVNVSAVLETVTATFRHSKASVTVRVLDSPTVGYVIKLVRMLNVDVLVVDKPNRPNWIDYLAPEPRPLEFKLTQLIKEAPAPVLIVPDEE